LRNSPFSLAKNDKIIARGKAWNIKGYNDEWSDTDDSDFTTRVEIEPDAPEAPLKGLDTTYNVLHAYWTAIPDYSAASGGVTAAI
jgi:hypothetical protein